MLTNLKKRVERFEEKQPYAYKSDLRERIERYIHILDTEDYSSPEGREIKQTLIEYGPALAEIDDF